MKKKKKMMLFIDGENVSAKKYPKIVNAVKKVGEIDDSRVYGLQKDTRTKKWSDKAKKDNLLKDIRLCGGPSKNKVDNKIKKDVNKTLNNNKNIDIVVIVSSDGGYADVVESAKKLQKKVVVIGEKNTPEKIRNISSEFIEI